MAFIRTDQLQSPVEGADIWVRAKDSGLGFHYGTGLSSGLIKDTMPETGKRITTLETFCDGKACFGFRPERSVEEKAAIELRAIQNFPGAYNGIVDNCEHDMTQAQTGEARSPSVNFWLGLAAGGALLLGVGKAMEPKEKSRRRRCSR